MKSSQKIVEYIAQNGHATTSDLVDLLEITDRAIRKQIRSLVDAGVIAKAGKPPKVYYVLANTTSVAEIDIDRTQRAVIEDNFLYITPSGQSYNGVDGFVRWCSDRGMDAVRSADQYLNTFKKYEKYRNADGLIDGTRKIKDAFATSELDRVFYVDFYAIEIFGKTKLGQMLLFAKQSQDRKLINEMADLVKPKIEGMIERYNIDAVGFIPPTVKRELQFIRQLERRLNLNVRPIAIEKVRTPVVVPQKTLNKIEDRVTNAKDTIVVVEPRSYNNILLIDDAVGSGATLNETAAKLRDKKIAKHKIIGLSITGSFKGFDVISEV